MTADTIATVFALGAVTVASALVLAEVAAEILAAFRSSRRREP